MSRPDEIAGDKLRAIIERIERIEDEIKELSEGKKEIYFEAKGNGFDVKILREVIRIRKQDQKAGRARAAASLASRSSPEPLSSDAHLPLETIDESRQAQSRARFINIICAAQPRVEGTDRVLSGITRTASMKQRSRFAIKMIIRSARLHSP
jgi:uncharacterized protein (UPF0335 family)